MRVLGIIVVLLALALAGVYFMISGLGGASETPEARRQDTKVYLVAGALGAIGIKLIMAGA